MTGKQPIEDKLKLYFTMPPEEVQKKGFLTEHEVKVLKRVEFAHDIYMDKRNNSETVRFVMRKFGISMPQAYRDLKLAKTVFATFNSIEKKFERVVFADELYATMLEAKAAGDFSAYARIAEIYRKTIGLDKEDLDLPDPEDFKLPEEVLIGDAEEILGSYMPKNFDEQLKKFYRQKTEENGIEDVDHEDL